MVTIQVEATLSVDKLVEAAAQLSDAELDHLLEQVVRLQEQLRASSHPEYEAGLLVVINRKLPIDVQRRYKVLRRKLHNESLTDDEHRELIDLSDQMEQKHAERLEALWKLAQLRNTTLPGIMADLGIKTPKVA